MQNRYKNIYSQFLDYLNTEKKNENLSRLF